MREKNVFMHAPSTGQCTQIVSPDLTVHYPLKPHGFLTSKTRCFWKGVFPCIFAIVVWHLSHLVFSYLFSSAILLLVGIRIPSYLTHAMWQTIVTGLFPYGGRGGWHAAGLCCRMVIYCEGGNAAMSLSR